MRVITQKAMGKKLNHILTKSGYWALATLVSTFFAVFLVLYTFNTSKTELIESASRFVKNAPYQTDSLTAARQLYQLLCLSSSLSNCSVSIWQGDILIARVPTVIKLDRNSHREKIVLDNFAPPLIAAVDFSVSRTAWLKLLGVAGLLWAVVFGLFAIVNLKISQLKQARELDQRRMQSEIVSLAAQVAHDIRSPLMALRALSETHSLKSDISIERAELMRSIAQRIEGIADNLLLRTRQSKESLKVALEPVGLKDSEAERSSSLSAKDLLKIVADAMEEKRAEISIVAKSIRIHFTPELPSEVLEFRYLVEEGGVRRIISNVLNNSIDAISSDGFISVDVDALESEFTLRIRDNGVGIEDEVQKRLFEPGFTESKPSGNGLGLYHAKNWLEERRGKISIVSEVGRGTVVAISLRAAT